ncbi:MAG: asparagine synthase (glutamine-hydrolyzing) [Acidobacteriota bacterium]|jgi:asparagine synthase (glutamine-hydrolysing)
MCGIAGVLISARISKEQVEHYARSMSDSLAHRGPDDFGVWSDPDYGIALSHRRLSIVDLSPAGHQPMISSDGRYVMILNGEIYNFQDLRSEVEARGIKLRGHSDTEVVIELFALCGIEMTVRRLIGMFAIAVWDRRARTLTLIRDRLGIKPVYWAKFNDAFLFGSELKALRSYPGWSPRLNHEAIAAYLRHNYVPAPHSVYEGVYKLEPGSILTLPWGKDVSIEKFWDARSVACAGLANPLRLDDREMVERLETLLRDAVRRRMVADVPLGAFLSGGIDSSTVVALMQDSSARPVRTYSIGFESAGYDESKHAAEVARHLRTEHTELVVTAKEAIDVIPKLPEFYDEPFADSSQIPTYLVSAMTRRHVTVALSGDGGDELFGGYTRYTFAQRFWRNLSLFPQPLRQTVAGLLQAVPPEKCSRLFERLPPPFRVNQAGDKLHKLASILALRDPDALYRRLVTHWEPATIMPGVVEPTGVLWDTSVRKDFSGLLERMQFVDMVTYLPDDILTKVDRASMAVGLEARVPLLDHRVVEFSWRIPREKLIQNRISKWPLRQILYRHVPPELIDRPKMGFGIPLGEWLRGPLRDWAEALLSERRLREVGILDVARIRRAWTEHLSGQFNWQYPLWDVLMLEAWRERWALA